MAELRPKLYQPGTHPRDLRKLREQAKVVPQGLPSTGMVDTAPKTKKVLKKLKISTQK